MTIVQLAAGLGLLVLGAELLVRGASRLAASVGVSQLVIGLTVVAYGGTSTPELAVSLQAALAGNADIAVANVVGSNIFNVLFILGACAAMKPLLVHRQLVRLEVPIMIAASVLLMALSWDGKLGRWDGALLFLGITVYRCGSSAGAAGRRPSPLPPAPQVPPHPKNRRKPPAGLPYLSAVC
jgi:cation:H+ antiporter